VNYVKPAAWTAGILAAVAIALLLPFALAFPSAWILVAGWAVGAVVVGIAWRQLHGNARLLMAIVLIPFCILLTWEGGLVLVPAALALVVAAVLDPHRTHQA